MNAKPLPKESIIKLQDYLNKFVRVKFQGGREVTGVLKSCDPHLNLILDDCQETLRDKDDPYILTKVKRTLGLVIARGSLISSIFPMDGSEEIENPFLNQNELQEDN